MTKLIKELKIEAVNIDECLNASFDYSDSATAQKLWDLISEYDGEEDIEVREYVNSDEYYLYNIHTTEDTLYVERYDSMMTEDNCAEVMQECKCIDITDEVDVVELLLRSLHNGNGIRILFKKRR